MSKALEKLQGEKNLSKEAVAMDFSCVDIVEERFSLSFQISGGKGVKKKKKLGELGALRTRYIKQTDRGKAALGAREGTEQEIKGKHLIHCIGF